MNYFLGIDVGSSKTHALIVDESGRCVGLGRSGGGNHQAVGYERLAEVLQRSFEAACQMAGISPHQIVGAGFGVAGFDFPSELEAHLRAVDSLGLACPVNVMNDGWNGLYAGATCGIGVNVAAGTGVNCRGRGKQGQEGRVVGNGLAFGEFGGAIDIVLRAQQLVTYAWIKRIPPTLLTDIFLEATGAKNELDLMEGLSNHTYHLYPHLAIQIMDAARRGDPAAKEVARWLGEELGWLAVSVTRQIEMQEDEVEVIQSGSVFEAGEVITGPMQEVVLAHCPKARLIRLAGPPVIGAVVLGMEQAGLDGYAVRPRMIQTARELAQG